MIRLTVLYPNLKGSHFDWGLLHQRAYAPGEEVFR